jgi:hypothetical protein
MSGENYPMETLFQHYGLDWIAMIINLYAAYLLGNNRKFGFILFATSNLFWMLLGVTTMTSYGVAIGNFVFFLINVRGYVKWSKVHS